jgi:hypothetical protein
MLLSFVWAGSLLPPCRTERGKDGPPGLSCGKAGPAPRNAAPRTRGKGGEAGASRPSPCPWIPSCPRIPVPGKFRLAPSFPLSTGTQPM